MQLEDLEVQHCHTVHSPALRAGGHDSTAVDISVDIVKVVNEGQQVDQTLHRVATKEREEIKGTTKQKMARRHSKEGGDHLDQETNRGRRKALMEGYILRWMDKA